MSSFDFHSLHMQSESQVGFGQGSTAVHDHRQSGRRHWGKSHISTHTCQSGRHHWSKSHIFTSLPDPLYQPPQLSKKEIEELLKKGAYGALMEEDDDANKSVDQIAITLIKFAVSKFTEIPFIKMAVSKSVLIKSLTIKINVSQNQS